MSTRMTAIVLHYVEAAIEEDLDVADEVKQKIEYEVMPFLAPGQPATPFSPPSLQLKFIIGVGLPDQAGDHHLLLEPLEDPHDPAEVSALVRKLFGQAQAEVAEVDTRARATSNGHKPKGLYLPG